MTDQAPPHTYVAHDGNTYPWPPPQGWWIASDGRYYPPESHPSRQAPAAPPAPGSMTQQGPPTGDGERPFWKKTWFIVTAALFALIVIGGALTGEDDAGTSETSAGAEQEPVVPATTAATSSTEAPTSSYPSFDEVEPYTEGYFIALESTTLAEAQGEERTWNLGIGVCRNLDRGNGIEDELVGLTEDARLPVDEAGSMVGAAVSWICPHHGPLVEEWLDANS